MCCFFWYLSGGVFWGKTCYCMLIHFEPRFTEWEYVLILQWEQLWPAGNLSLSTAAVPSCPPWEWLPRGWSLCWKSSCSWCWAWARCSPWAGCEHSPGSLLAVARVGVYHRLWGEWIGVTPCTASAGFPGPALLRTWDPRWLYGSTTPGQHLGAQGGLAGTYKTFFKWTFRGSCKSVALWRKLQHLPNSVLSPRLRLWGFAELAPGVVPAGAPAAD